VGEMVVSFESNINIYTLFRVLIPAYSFYAGVMVFLSCSAVSCSACSFFTGTHSLILSSCDVEGARRKIS